MKRDLNYGGKAVIDGGNVVIRFPLDAMQSAVDGAWGLRAIDQRQRITDRRAFAVEFVHALNKEDEQGTTMIHKMADRAFEFCIDQGAEGIKVHEEQNL